MYRDVPVEGGAALRSALFGLSDGVGKALTSEIEVGTDMGATHRPESEFPIRHCSSHECFVFQFSPSALPDGPLQTLSQDYPSPDSGRWRSDPHGYEEEDGGQLTPCSQQ